MGLLNRRAFLQGMGMATGAVFTAPFVPQASAAAPGLRMGLLVPDSERIPGPGMRFLRGLQASFDTRRQALDAPIAWGCSTAARAAAQARPMLADGHRLLVWFSDSPVTPQLRDLLAEKQAVLLQAGLGANLPSTAEAGSNVYFHSLGLWQAAWKLGEWAAQNVGKRAWVFISQWECGFDLPLAFSQPFEAAGGQVLRRVITGLKPGDLEAALAEAEKERPDFVAAFYSGKEADAFLPAYQKSPLSGLPLLGHGLLAPRGVKRPAVMVIAQGWEERLYAASTDLVHLLAYETGDLLGAAVEAAGEDGPLAFEGLSFNSLRGGFRFLPGARLTSGPVYLYAGNRAPRQFSAPALQSAALVRGLSSGWLDTYLR